MITGAFNAVQDCLIRDAEPSVRLRCYSMQPWFDEYPFTMLKKEQYTEQSPVFHPEGSVWEHTVRVVDEAAKRKTYSSDITVFMWAALLHDIGKPETTRIRKGKITAYDHDSTGAELSRRFLAEFTVDNVFIERVALLVKYHMQALYVKKSLPFADIRGMVENGIVEDVALLSFCDRLGRANADSPREREAVRALLKACGMDPDLAWL